MELIKEGYTNKSFKKDNIFYQEKKHNGFNHKVDYTNLSKLDFVPKLIENNEKYSKWEYIKTKKLELNEKNLRKIAKNFKTLHESNIKFPKNTMARRIKMYRQQVNELGRKIDVLDKYYKRINNILAKSNTTRPIHNDLYFSNIILDENEKLYFVDWEYASMGDKHFDLALFICASDLNKEQEKIFLNEYDTYWEEYLIQQKILACYFIIIWAVSKLDIPINYEYYVKMIQKIDDEFQIKKQTNSFRIKEWN
ncbi:phosphotransferase [Mycoplasmopsis columbina]|uniref:PTS system, lichenan-specific IIA component LicA n=1 Tax=Mycoplasmopsis columbina SF7 TaxID=1037410 RepID=F9UKG4_9BACT|nr:phosphotransferase [Mycoplasmopsis columbina]EGV00169.1 PTS system, lichenan-specific IIA component LicA [Mycoplasmopsis columbina SF7]VEU77063.1 PTS lichenan-specific IIA component domain protein [Mycoplasmopsis columbina]